MNEKTPEKPSYRGRFAPSPTGLLHLGSLVAAVGSFVDARANNGKWLLRIEDIDPPREEAGAKAQVPRQLEDHGLEWDGPISYQSDHSNFYRETLDRLAQSGTTYRCSCSRQQVREMNGIYDGRCQRLPPAKDAEAAIRLHIEGVYEWKDLIQGLTHCSEQDLGGDFIIHRKDGLFSYQLAVAVDDHNQGITHVIRGADLIDSTARQGLVMLALNWKPPIYGHLPMVLGEDGDKLSKQTHAPVLDANRVCENLIQALQILGQEPPQELSNAARTEILQWAISHWNIGAVPSRAPSNVLGKNPRKAAKENR